VKCEGFLNGSLNEPKAAQKGKEIIATKAQRHEEHPENEQVN
jgi:hypothetical protein